MLHTIALRTPPDHAIYAAVERRMSDPSGPDTQSIIFAGQLAWIAEQELASFQAQAADIDLDFSFADLREAVLLRLRWCS